MLSERSTNKPDKTATITRKTLPFLVGIPLCLGITHLSNQPSAEASARNAPANSVEEEVQNVITVPEGDVPALIDAIENANENPGEAAVIEVSGTYTLSPEVDERIPFWHEGNTGLPAIESDITIEAAAREEATIQRDPDLECELDETTSDDKFRVLYVAEVAALSLEHLTISHGCADDTLSDNRAGGGLLNSGGSVQIINSTFSVNSAGSDGGGIRNRGDGDLLITDSEVSANIAGFNGGGVHHSGISAGIIESTISDNISELRGGGIRSTSDMTITDSDVAGNSAGSTGGGIENSGTGVLLRIDESRILDNTADRNGGGLRTQVSSVEITDSKFAENNSGENGAGIQTLFPGWIEITNSEISGNEAEGDGGGIWNSGLVQVASSKITDNVAFGETFGNEGDGGGIFSDASGDNKLTRSTLARNSASGFGGGLANRDFFTIEASTISENEAEEDGGAIDNAGILTVRNSTIWSNYALNGGGISNAAEGETGVSATTLAENIATEGGGISNEANSSFSIKNSIVANSISGGECYNNGDFNALGENLSSDASCPDFSHPGTDPLLDPSGLQDHDGPTETIALMPGSPAFDAVTVCSDLDGNPIETDQRGTSRPQVDACDLGAIETAAIEREMLSIHPGRGGDAGIVTVTIFGNGFEEDHTVKLVHDDYPDIQGEVLSVAMDGRQMQAQFDLFNQPHGLWDLEVTDAEGISVVQADVFSIEAGEEPELWVEIQGANQLESGSTTTVNINFGNSGGVDIYDALLFITLPRELDYQILNDAFLTTDITAILEDMNIDHDPDFIDRNYETEEQIILPIWLYTVSAESSASLSLRINVPEFNESATLSNQFDKPIEAEIGGLPLSSSEFTRTGDPEISDPALLYTFIGLFIQSFDDEFDFEKVKSSAHQVNHSTERKSEELSGSRTAGSSFTHEMQSIDCAADPGGFFDPGGPPPEEVLNTWIRQNVERAAAAGIGGAILTGVGFYACGIACAGIAGGAVLLGTLYVAHSDLNTDFRNDCEPPDGIGNYDPETCSGDDCQGGSRSFGHPHFMTFDRMDYDFQAVGEFILTRSTIDETEVQIRLEQFDPVYENFTIITAGAINVAGDEIVFEENRESFENVPDLRINGAPTDLPQMGTAPMALPGGGTITRAGRTFMVDWPDSETRVDVRQSNTRMGMMVEPMLSATYAGNLEGLLGTMDGTIKTDFTMRDGTVLIPPLNFDELYRDFGDSWRITDEESLFGTPTFEGPEIPTQHITTDDLDPAAVAEAEEICADYGVEDPILMDNCVFDVAITGDERFADDTIELITPTAEDQVDDWMSDDESKIQITVDSDPKTDEEFSFVASGELENFTLIDDENRSDRSQTIAFARIASGTYEFNQQLPDEEDWKVSEINCQGGEEIAADLTAGTVTIDLTEGEVVRCTYVNSGPVTTSADEDEKDLPQTYALEQNYPNPFNPATVIEYALPEPGDVELTIYNILGRRVATLVNDQKQAGRHQVTFDAGHLASGVYIYRLRADGFEQTRQFTLIK